MHHCTRNRVDGSRREGQGRKRLEAGEVEPRRHSGTGPAEGRGYVPRRTGSQSQRAGGKCVRYELTLYKAPRGARGWRERNRWCLYHRPGMHVENAVRLFRDRRPISLIFKYNCKLLDFIVPPSSPALFCFVMNLLHSVGTWCQL